jgi:integrase
VSPSAFITTRNTGSGPRYVVRYRLGGRYTKLAHAGSFKTMRDARTRKDFVTAELAAGRDPALALRALETPTLIADFDTLFGQFIDSRIDVGKKTISLYRNARSKLGALADRDPHTLRPADFQTWLAKNAELAPKTLRHYLGSMRQVLDFADIEPNPARSRKVKLPTRDAAEVSPPSSAEWRAAKGQLSPRLTLAARLIECDALRIGEAMQLTYGDVDFQAERIRISRVRTKGGTAGQRWLPVPTELLQEIDELVPLEDRARGRRVFPLTEGQIRGGLERACRMAKIAHYHPHDLRHRRISLWVAHGIDPRTVALWSGHARTQMSLDVYSHVVIDPSEDEWREFWVGFYAAERLPSVKEVERDA